MFLLRSGQVVAYSTQKFFENSGWEPDQVFSFLGVLDRKDLPWPDSYLAETFNHFNQMGLSPDQSYLLLTNSVDKFVGEFDGLTDFLNHLNPMLAKLATLAWQPEQHAKYLELVFYQVHDMTRKEVEQRDADLNEHEPIVISYRSAQAALKALTDFYTFSDEIKDAKLKAEFVFYVTEYFDQPIRKISLFQNEFESLKQSRQQSSDAVADGLLKLGQAYGPDGLLAFRTLAKLSREVDTEFEQYFNQFLAGTSDYNRPRLLRLFLEPDNLKLLRSLDLKSFSGSV